ncbi:MAG TPA: hypothetical protein VGR50_03240 [Terriglobales bacterium]|nr:hypothetical protein [Terriglobales bacterium]
MRRRILNHASALLAAAVSLVPVQARAQASNAMLIAANSFAAPEVPFDVVKSGYPATIPALTPGPAELPRMSPEMALAAFERRLQLQLAGVPSYSASTVISVDLPDTRQHGVFELQKGFSAPHTLRFTPVRYSGDGFVKSSVITRLLQQEVTQTQNGDAVKTALSAQNYKFQFKGEDTLSSRSVYVYQVKPRAKVAGLFKGHIYLDARSGVICRAEGELVKSPSFFIRKIRFTSDFAEVNGYSLSVHIQSEAETRIIGRAQVDITNSDYSFAESGTTIASR